MAFTTRCILCFSTLIALCLQGCSTLFGTGRYETVGVEGGVSVADLSTNEYIYVGASDTNSHMIRLRNGYRYALRVEKDSQTNYVFMSPRGDGLSVLNMLSPLGVGFIVDHFNRAAYSYDRKFIASNAKNAVPADMRAAVEDSLRARLTPVIPVSLINDREQLLLSAWMQFGWYFGPDVRSMFGFGAGVVVLPWMMPLAELEFSGTSIKKLAGIQLQEPTSGFCAAYRYGWSEATTYYILSAGITAQWYRFELRFKNQTSVVGRETEYVPAGWSFGLNYTVQVML